MWVCCVLKTLLDGAVVRSPTPHQNLPCTEKKMSALFSVSWRKCQSDISLHAVTLP